MCMFVYTRLICVCVHVWCKCVACACVYAHVACMCNMHCVHKCMWCVRVCVHVQHMHICGGVCVHVRCVHVDMFVLGRGREEFQIRGPCSPQSCGYSFAFQSVFSLSPELPKCPPVCVKLHSFVARTGIESRIIPQNSGDPVLSLEEILRLLA